MNTVKNLIVGCGISGAVIARQLAEAGEKALVIDIKNHIGGNIYDYSDNGITVHKYGPHIFHTNNKEVWDFISRFTKWLPYQHKVLGLVDGQFIPIPFNLNSLRKVFPTILADKIETKLLDKFGINKKVPILELRQAGDKDLEFLAQYIYEKIFLEYTIKQWGLSPDKIDPNVSARVPVYISRDDRYFQDKYQGIPLNGYTAMIKQLLNHPNIEVCLKKPFDKNRMKYTRLFWTGSVDELFEYKFGELPYRSVYLDFQKHNSQEFQKLAVINYPCNYDFTRICEYKWFLNEQSDKIIISYEYPQKFKLGKNDRCYPIVSQDNNNLYDKYLDEVKKLKNVYCLGRLGDYKYYDMDKAVLRALELYGEILK